jgi:uncharacterized SAM-binding protein YcdF (DUF218 family)
VAWNDPEIAEPLQIAWAYMRLVHLPRRADAILTLGSFDPNAAVHAARLWCDGLAPLIVMSGGIAHQGGLLDTGWDRPEAHVFAEIAIREGVPTEAILIEDRAQNTGENFTLGMSALDRAGIKARNLLVVAKPYMTRRGYATGRKVLPDLELSMQCEEIDCMRYFARERDPERALLAMVGDLHRLLVYPQLGFQIEQPMPELVQKALAGLVAAGYGQRLVAGYDLSGRGSEEMHIK